jgi:hypothetical protein
MVNWRNSIPKVFADRGQRKPYKKTVNENIELGGKEPSVGFVS